MEFCTYVNKEFGEQNIIVSHKRTLILYTKAYKKKKSIMRTQDYKDLNEEHNPFSCPASPFLF